MELDDICAQEFEREREEQCGKERTVFTYGSNKLQLTIGDKIPKNHWGGRATAYNHMMEALEEYTLQGRTSADLYEVALDGNNKVIDYDKIISIPIDPENQ